MSGTVAGLLSVVGVAETTYSARSGRQPRALAAEAILAALSAATIPPQEIDGLIPIGSDVSAQSVTSLLRLRDVRFCATAPAGGAAAVASLQLAAAAVASGIARVLVVYVARNGNSQRRIADRVHGLPGQELREQLERPYGWMTPAHWYATICQLHMERYGTTKRQMGAVAVTMRQHANLNRNAMMYGRPMTIDDYLASDPISSRYQKLDCCLETDGACAVVVTSTEEAARRSLPGVQLLAVAEGHPDTPDDLTNRPDLLEIGLSKAAPRAWEMASLGPAEMDGAMIYDCFTFELLHQLEAMGFCAAGESGSFVENGNIELGGQLPVNSHGGLLSEAHMVGLNHVVEAYRQLRGRCGKRQIAAARHIAVTGWGNLGDGAVAIFRKTGSDA
jgi:acetyl-CoA acetyltransferase